MPKRIPTPPSDNNTYYFTVVRPYPLNANWELKADQITFARWIACCIPDKNTFIAIMYKPTARGMVLIEVDRAFTQHEILLGQHSWSEFLQRPTSEEKDRTTEIFYSIYSDHRSAQKDGWKTINVVDSWYEKWSPTNKIIRFPYPKTKWCAPPPEDKTNKNICRPLPVIHFPPPAKAAKPVVGSDAWVNTLTAPSPNSAEIQRDAWNSGLASSINNVRRTKNSAPIAPVRSNATSAAKQTNAWGPRKSDQAAFPPAPGATAPAPVKAPQGAWGSKSPAVTSSTAPKPAAPANAWSPSRAAVPTSSTSAWGAPRSAASSSVPQRPVGSPSTAATTSLPSPPGLVRDISGQSGSVSSTSSGVLDWAAEVAAEEAMNNNAQYDELVAETGNLAVTQSLEAALHGLEASDDEDFESAWDNPQFNHSAPTFKVKREKVEQNLWSDYVPPAEQEEEDICQVHGVVCSKGICKYAAKKEREKKREEQLKNGRGGSGARRRGRGGQNTNSLGNSNSGSWRNGGRSNVRSSSNSNSNSSPASSRSASKAQSTLAPEPNFDHDDDEDPWGD